jgi:hypothetical protein
MDDVLATIFDSGQAICIITQLAAEINEVHRCFIFFYRTPKSAFSLPLL